MSSLLHDAHVILSTYEVVITCGTGAEAQRLETALRNDGFRVRRERRQLVSEAGIVTTKRERLRD